MNAILVIIPMYGQEEHTLKCIELTKKNAGLPVDILVVDDGSKVPFRYFDENETDYPTATLRLSENGGFTNAVNQGILWAGDRYEYIHLLNNDTEPYPDFIGELSRYLYENPKVSIASSVRLHPKGESYEVELYGIDLLRGYQAVTSLENLKDEVIQCNWVPLCSSLIRTSTILELGLLDRRMRTHSSDLDYCLRVKMMGYEIVVVTNSKVIHHHEVTTRANGISPEHDQRVLLEKLAGLQYAQLMNAIPLDVESKTYGKLEFKIEQR